MSKAPLLRPERIGCYVERLGVSDCCLVRARKNMESTGDAGRPAGLLIAGASVRAAVMSAQATNCELFAADLFVDQELAICRQTERLGDHYEGLREFAQSVQPDFWMYTGSLENHPRLVSAVCEHSRLLGTPAEILNRIRNPSDLSSVLTRSGFAFPEIAEETRPIQTTGPSQAEERWIIKSRQSAAGLGISRADSNAALKPQQYFQRLIQGVPVSAAFLVDEATVTFLGSSLQRMAGPSFSPTEFLYGGSIGPLPLSTHEQQRWERLGCCLTDEYDLRGLIGVDAVVADNELYVLEVNPRYTASMEVLERASDMAFVPAHITACRDELGQGVGPHFDRAKQGRLCGKAVIYAPCDIHMSQAFSDELSDMNRNELRFVDIPQIGNQILAQHPLLTVLADGSSVEDVQRQLDDRSRQIRERFQ